MDETIKIENAIKMNRHQRRALAKVNKVKKIDSQVNIKKTLKKDFKHLMYVPFTGLGLYNGFRGNKWLKNRIKVFKQFVVPSLHAQTNQNFIIWISWRPEEKNNPIVQEFKEWLDIQFPSFYIKNKIVFTYNGVCFYDDKYPDAIARDRLLTSLHGSMQTLVNAIGECEYVLMTIQPSDDLYNISVVEGVQNILHNDMFDAVGFKNGYICNYITGEVAEYNPETNPPFYTIKFPREVFIDPLKHANFTSLKKDVGIYKTGTPCPSHEYIGECMRYALMSDMRGFLVGTHSQNISTTFTNPYKGPIVDRYTLRNFGVYEVPLLKIKISLFKKILLKMPYRVQRKIRYITYEWKVFKLSTYKGLIK